MTLIDDDRSEQGSGIDAAALEACLDVLAEAEALPLDHPDAIAVQRATASLYKTVKQRRRAERRAAVLAADEAVTAATATGAPGRIDDETRGLPLVSNTRGATAGTLIQPRACYVCKTRYVDVDAFYHQLCPDCAASHHERRDQRTDLTGRRALLTGGRAKIGMYIALRLLRDGAHTTITTRFPNDAVRRFTDMPDSADWLHRLRIVGIDLRDPAQVVELADSVAAQGPLDILINNAAQTVRRSAEAYAPLASAEAMPLPAGPLPEVVSFGRVHDADRQALPGPRTGHWAPTPDALTAMALTAGSASPAQIAANRAIDAGGLVPDLHQINSWTQHVQEVDPIEMLEVQLCNMTAPFILVSRLRASMASAAARRKYVVNVSAMEGQFGRGYKGPGHPHTNMAKAALNMLTRTSAQEMLTRRDPDDERRHRVDHGRATASHEDAAGRRGLPRAAGPGRRRRSRVRPGGPGRERGRCVRMLPQGLQALRMVTHRRIATFLTLALAIALPLAPQATAATSKSKQSASAKKKAKKKKAKKKPSLTRDALFVGNNWDGTIDVVDPNGLKRRIARINAIPDVEQRKAEIAANPVPARLLPRHRVADRRGARPVRGRRLQFARRSLHLHLAAEPRGRRRDRTRDPSHRVARPGRGQPCRPHGDLARRQAAAGVGLHRAQGPRHRHGVRQDRREHPVRRPAARVQLLRRRQADLPRVDRDGLHTCWTTTRSTARRAIAGSRSSTPRPTRSPSGSTSARSCARSASPA